MHIYTHLYSSWWWSRWHSKIHVQYMTSLQEIKGCRPQSQPRLPPGCGRVIPPLTWRYWAQSLAQHPDREFAAYVVQGIHSGFQVGFDYAHVQCTPAKWNMPSADEHASVVTGYLQGEVAQGCVCSPFVPASWPQV